MAGIINEKPPVKVLNPEEQALIATCTGTAKSYTDATFKFRRQWYLNDNFYDGKHFVWWRKSTGTIDRIQPPKGSVLRSIPKASRQIDAVQNLITANRPRWVVYPEENVEGMVTEDAEKIAAKKRQWLEYQWDRNNMDEKIDDLVHYALKYPFSFFEVGFEKDMTVTVWDACDILYKPDVNSIYDSPMIVKSMRKSLKEVQKNPVYNENKMAIGTSQKFSADEMKDMRLAEKFGYIQGKEEQDGCLLQEFYLKEFVKDEMTGEEKQKIRIITIANEGVLLRNELTDLDEYPFAIFSPKSGPYYQPAWIERLMPANKSLDLIVSNIENFFHLMTKGYWIKHRNANVSRIVNENGAFIEWDVMAPTQARLEGIPNYVFAHLANLEKWIEEQSTSSVSVGRVPKGVKAYKAIESLKQSDYTGMKVTMTRLETTLEKVAELMLSMADKYYDTPQTVYRLHEEKPDYFNVIGGRYAQSYSGQENPPIALNATDKVDVVIESGLAYTEEGKRDTMMELYAAGLMPAEQVLKSFRFSDVGGIIRAAQAEKQVSMIDTADFEALSDPTKEAVLAELQTKNINLPQTPQPEMMRFRRRQRTTAGGKGD